MSDEIADRTNYALVDVISIAANTVINLLRERNGYDHKRFGDKDLEGFGTNGEIGPLASMQGLRSVLGSVIALGEEPGFAAAMEQIKSDWPSLIEEWGEVLERLDDGFTTAAPYEQDGRLLAVIKRADGPEVFTDTTSWAISTAVAFRKVVDDFGFPASAELVTQSIDVIASGLRVLTDVQLPDGGWSFSASNVEEGGSDLVFTYSVQQALADIDDYILQRLEGVDHESATVTPLVEQLNTRIAAWPIRSDEAGKGPRTLLDIYTRLTEGSVKFLIDRFIIQATAGSAGRGGGLEVEDLEVKGRIKLLNERHDLVAAYYEGYLLEGLIISRADEYRPDVAEPMRQLYYRLIGRFGELSAKMQRGAEIMTDPAMTTLRIELSGPTRRKAGAQPTTRYADAGLWAQILRAMILFRYYVEPLSQPEAVIVGKTGSVLSLLLKDRRAEDDKKEPGLWDNFGFNLAYTARAIEAIIDSYDYLKRVEATAASVREGGSMPASRVPSLEELLASAMAPALDQMIKERIGDGATRRQADQLVTERKGTTTSSENMLRQILSYANKAFFDQRERGSDDYTNFEKSFIAATPFSHEKVQDKRFSRVDELLLARELTTFVYFLVANLLPRILAEATYNHMTPWPFDSESAEQRARKIGAHGLHERFDDFFSRLASIEIQHLKAQQADSAPIYGQYLSNAFSGSEGRRR